MAATVVDASALAALLFGERDAEGVAHRLQGAEMVAPALLPFELTNVCWKKRRFHPELADAFLEGLRRFSRMGVRLVEVDTEGVLALAEAAGLTSYDAAYLWLARRLGSELVTLDRSLDKACRQPWADRA
jgi:predicted nucleic acid-binding protein